MSVLAHMRQGEHDCITYCITEPHMRCWYWQFRVLAD